MGPVSTCNSSRKPSRASRGRSGETPWACGARSSARKRTRRRTRRRGRIIRTNGSRLTWRRAISASLGDEQRDARTSTGGANEKGGDEEAALLLEARRQSLRERFSGSAMAERFWSTYSLNFSERLADGFFYPHPSDWGTLNAKGGRLPKFESLRAVEDYQGDREVVIVDRCGDVSLEEFMAYCFDEIGHIEDRCDASPELARLVAERMGGAAESDDALRETWESERARLIEQHGSLIFPVGSMKVGLQRHRAILFKAVADFLEIPSQLLRGKFYCGDEEAVMIIVMCGGMKRMLNLMQEPGRMQTPYNSDSTPAIDRWIDIRANGQWSRVTRRIGDAIPSGGYYGRPTFRRDVSGRLANARATEDSFAPPSRG